VTGAQPQVAEHGRFCRLRLRAPALAARGTRLDVPSLVLPESPCTFGGSSFCGGNRATGESEQDQTMKSQEDLYEILQVSPRAEPEVIEAAYKQLALKYHPDRNHEPSARQKMSLLNEAYAVLSDPERRRAYDAGRSQALARPPQPPSGESRKVKPRPAVERFFRFALVVAGLVVLLVTLWAGMVWLLTKLVAK
jgi:hypothetical protein